VPALVKPTAAIAEPGVFKVAIWVEAFFSSSGEQMPRLIAVTARNLLLAGGL
jgi:hypothetical protein